jgi:hypothetical protein
MEISLRGIGRGVVSIYLVDLGGRGVEPGKIAGDGWEASITASDPVNVGAIRLGVSEVVFGGEPALLARLREAFDRHMLRAGG